MICDIHCHILPGVDDGARDKSSTKRMLELASSEGIDVLVATPHFQLDRTYVETRVLKKTYEEVSSRWKKYGKEKKMYLGNEIFYSEGIVEALEQGKALTINGTKYVLVEFPVYADYPYIRRGIQQLQYAGYWPILAHIERYGLLEQPKQMQDLIDMGAYLQVNVSTILGKHGFWKKRTLIRLMKRDMIHFVATDAHDSRHRRPEMKKCSEYMDRKLGTKRKERILKENPEIMLRGEKLYG